MAEQNEIPKDMLIQQAREQNRKMGRDAGELLQEKRKTRTQEIEQFAANEAKKQEDLHKAAETTPGTPLYKKESGPDAPAS